MRGAKAETSKVHLRIQLLILKAAFKLYNTGPGLREQVDHDTQHMDSSLIIKKQLYAEAAVT